MAHFGMDRGGSGGYGHDFSELITMASGNPSTYGGMQRPAVQQQQQQQQHSSNAGVGVGRGGHRKAPPGHKLCEKCGEASPVRYPNCKDCNEPFPMGIRKQKRIKAAEQAQMKEQAMRVHYQQQHPQQQQQQQQHEQEHFMPQQPLLSGFPVPLTPNYPMQLPRVQSALTRPVGPTPFNQHHSTPGSGSGGGAAGPLVVFPPSTDRLSVNDADDDQSIPSLQSLPSEESPKQAQSAPSDVRQLSLTNGKQILFFVHNGIAHLSFPDLQSMMPQNLRQVLEKILTTMDFSPDEAKRSEVLLLASRKVVSETETNVQLYPASDVQKMFTILNLPVPDFILRAAQGEFPQERVDMTEFQTDEAASPTPSTWIPTLFSRDKKDPPSSLTLEGHTPSVGSHFVSPSLPSRGVSSAYHAHDGRITSAAFKESKIGSDITYATLPWGSETLTVLYPKNKEPYVCITELNRKLLQVGTKKCQQRRFSLGIDSIPTTAEQVHQLKMLGSLSDKVVYTRLLRLREACKLSESFGLLVPENVNNEWGKYVQFSKEQSSEQVFEGDDLPIMSGSHDHLDSPTTVMMVDDGLDTEEPVEDDVKELQDGNFYHPDFINLDDDNCSEEGIMKQFRWNGRIYTTFSTRHNIHYMTLAELYDHFLQPKGVTKVNMTYRMRKLNLRTIRSSSWVRLRMIILGSHSPHIPVCCLLQMEDCVKLLKCFHIQLPSILKKVFLIGNKKIYKHKLVCQEPESLVVKVPRSHCKQFPPVKEPVNQSRMDIVEHKHVSQPGSVSGSAGSQVVRDAQGAARRCPHCKHLTPVVKKRCQNCKAFLVGLPCPSCGILNHNRSSYCWKCNSPLEFRETASATSPRKQHIIGAKVQMAQSVSAVYTDSDDGSNDEGKSTTGHHKNHASSAGQPSRVTTFKVPPGGDSSKAQMGIRMCGECGQTNSNKSKKCYRCSKPLIGRPCLSCGRPNHSHSVQCWKCGSSIAGPLKGGKDTPASSDTVGRYKKSRQLGRSQTRRRSTTDSSLLEDLERNRAQTFCIRCHTFRCSGRFRCGRCGDVFHTKPVFDNEPDEEESTPSGEGMSCTALSASSPKRNQEDTQKAASSDKVEQGSSPNAQPQDRSPLQQDGRQQQQSRKPEDPSEATPPPDSVMLTFGKAVYGSGVGRKIAEMLEADDKDIGQQLPTAEQQYKDAKSLHDRFRHKHRTELNRIQDRQATLDGLIARSDFLVSKIHKLSSKESGALVLLKELPSSYQTLKKEIDHKTKLLAALDKHVIGPLALSTREDDLSKRDKLISAIETTLNDEQRDVGEVFAASPIANGASDTALSQDDDRQLMDQDEHPQNGLLNENGHELQESDECMEVDPKLKESPKRVQQEMEVEGTVQREHVMVGQKPEANEQGMELLSSGIPGAAVNALAHEAALASVDAEPTDKTMEKDNAEMKTPSTELERAEVDKEAPATELGTSSTEAETAAAELNTAIDAEVAQIEAFPSDVEAPNTEPKTPNSEVKTVSTEAESPGIQLAASEVEGPDREVESVLQKNAVEMLPLLNYSNSPDIVSQQAEETTVQEDSGKDNKDTVCSAKTMDPGTDQHVEEATPMGNNGEVDQNVCETPEVSPGSDGVSSPLGLESPKSTHNVPSVVSGRGRRQSSLHEQDSKEPGEGSPPPSKVRKLSEDSFPQVSNQESSKVSVYEGSLHLDQLPAEAHKEMPRTMSVDETDREGEWQQQVDSVQKMGTVTSTPISEQGGASPMDSSYTNVDETVEEGMSQSQGKQEEEPLGEGSTPDSSMALPLAKSPNEETKGPVEETKSLIAPLPVPAASESSSGQVSGPAAGTLAISHPVKSPTHLGRKRSKSADSPVSGGESSVGSKRRHSESGDISIRSPVGSSMPPGDTSKIPLEREVHDAVGQPDHETEMDVSEMHPPLEETAQKVGGIQSGMAEEAFSPVSSIEDATVSAEDADVNRPTDAACVVQKDSINADEVNSDRMKERESEVFPPTPKSPEEPVDCSLVESTDAALLSEVYTEVDRVLSPIMEEGPQDLLECDADEQKLDEDAPRETNPADSDKSSAPAVCSGEGEFPEDKQKGLELRDMEAGGSKSSEQHLVDDTTPHSVETKDDKPFSPTKATSPVPSEDEPIPPGTEGDAIDEVEYAPCHLSSPRDRNRSGSKFDSQEPAEVQMDTSASEEATGSEHEELTMDYDTHKCATNEEFSHGEVDNDTAVDEMETEEHAAELIQLQAEDHLPISEELSSANVDHCDASNWQATATGEDEEDSAGEPKRGVGSDKVSLLVNVAEVLSPPAQCAASCNEPVVSAAEVVDSPKETVVPHRESMATPTDPITSPEEPATSPEEPATSSKEPAISPEEPATSPEEPATSPKEPAISSKEPITSPKEPATSPKEPATSPKEPVTSSKEPAISSKEPITSPKEPATSPVTSLVPSPKEPIASPKEPIASPKEPIASPKEPISPPTEPVVSPTEPVASPTEPVASPTEPVASPTEPVASPTEPVVSPTEPVVSPKEPITSLTEHIASPEDVVTTIAEPSTPSSAAEHAAPPSEPPTAGVPVKGEDQTQCEGLDGNQSEVKDDPEPPVDMTLLEEGLLDDLLDETGQVTQGGSEEACELHPADVSLLDDDWSIDRQLAEPAADGERAAEGSDGEAGQKQQGVDYEEMGEKVEQSTANESGSKGVSEEEEGKCAVEGEESVDFRSSLNTSDPSASEQVHKGEESAGSTRETHSSSTAPVPQEPEETNPDQSHSKGVGGTEGNSAIRGLVAYGDSGSSSEDENPEETTSVNPSTQSAMGVQPETGEQLHEGSHGSMPQEAERLNASSSEAAHHSSEGSPSNAGNGQEEMDTSTVAEEDCSEEMDVS